MQINIKNTTIKITPRKTGHENLIANANVTFKTETEEHFTVLGFSIWKSKFEGMNVEMPKSGFFKFFLADKSFWSKLKEEILEAYDRKSIEEFEIEDK